MSLMECWLLGSRVKVSTTPDDEADIQLGWRSAPGFVPVMLAKKRFPICYAAGWAVRPAREADAAAIRGMYAMTGGQAVLLPVRDGLWAANGALVAEDPKGNVCAYCVGSALGSVWNIHEWGVLPGTETEKAASALAAANGCRQWQMRAEFAPAGGETSAGECIYVKVAKPFLLGTEMVEDGIQLAVMIEGALAMGMSM